MIPQRRLIEPTDTEVAEYRPISGWAVVGLILGLLSPLALVAPLFWAMPVIGIIVNCLALRRVKQDALAVIGRKAALAGLWLSVFSLAAAPSDWLYYRWRMRDEARQTALFWFEMLAKNRPEMAFELALPPQERHPFDEKIVDLYKYSDKWHKILEKYIAPEEPSQLVPTLLKLGDAAEVRYVRTFDQSDVDNQEFVDQSYAVSYAESGEKKTFFVNIRVVRFRTINNHTGWRIVGAQVVANEEGKNPP